MSRAALPLLLAQGDERFAVLECVDGDDRRHRDSCRSHKKQGGVQKADTLHKSPPNEVVGLGYTILTIKLSIGNFKVLQWAPDDHCNTWFF